jgi:hypothetical protein
MGENMQDQKTIAAARIGSATGYFSVGAALLAFGLFAAIAAAAAGGGSGAAGAAALCFTFASLLIAIGFWVRLFGLIERRLIDVQRAILTDPSKTQHLAEQTGQTANEGKFHER